MYRHLTTIVILSLTVAFLCEITSGEKLIVNTDAGGDDALALLLILRYVAANENSNFEVIAITCSYGNTEVKNVETNVLRTLTLAGRTDIPVYRGATKGFNEPYATDYYFGTDGFSNANFSDDEAIIAQYQSKHAAVALVDLAKQYSGNVSILSLGPLTNIALAIALDNNFTKNVKQFYVMGASVAGDGNIKPNAEFNVNADPESAYALFNDTSESQITLVPWETVRDSELTKDWRLQVLGKYDSSYIKFINKIEQKIFNFTSDNKWISADATTAACILDPSLVIDYKVRNVQAVRDGLARGSVLVDYAQNSGLTKNAKIVLKVNNTLYKNMLVKYLTCEQISCKAPKRFMRNTGYKLN